ncbi:hypothetical protein L3Q82_003114 [Scortum barcoo]|uniref:Uncharacterized protein n=1 Tax=Scortum barcoo TaxID=214431 RepID=A0ACB8VR71_9TELE|nr:hypothetical protein L3Q82_003114 [Scortum barcoo]
MEQAPSGQTVRDPRSRTAYLISRGRVLRSGLTPGGRNEAGCGAGGTGGSTYRGAANLRVFSPGVFSLTLPLIRTARQTEGLLSFAGPGRKQGARAKTKKPPQDSWTGPERERTPVTQARRSVSGREDAHERARRKTGNDNVTSRRTSDGQTGTEMERQRNEADRQHIQKDTSRLDKLIRRAGSVVGTKLDSLVTVAESRTLDKLLDIMDNASHPLHTVISNQRSLFSERLLLPKGQVDPNHASKLVPPQYNRATGYPHYKDHGFSPPEGSYCLRITRCVAVNHHLLPFEQLYQELSAPTGLPTRSSIHVRHHPPAERQSGGGKRVAEGSDVRFNFVHRIFYNQSLFDHYQPLSVISTVSKVHNNYLRFGRREPVITDNLLCRGSPQVWLKSIDFSFIFMLDTDMKIWHYAPGRVSHGKQVLGDQGQTKSGSQAHHEQKNIKDRYVARIGVTAGPHPGARPGVGTRRRAPGGRVFAHGTRPGSARNGERGPAFQ